MANTASESKELTVSKVLRRLPIYLGLALAALAVMTLVVAVSIHFGLSGYLSGGWIGFVGYTGLLFWTVVRMSKQHWHHRSFWPVIAVLLTAHCYVFVSILRVYPEWRVIWFWPVTVVEAGVIGGTLEWLYPERHERRRRDLN